MPARKTPLVNDYYYHIFNRIQNKEPLFDYSSACRRFVKTMDYYRYGKMPLRLSHFLENASKSKIDELVNVFDGLEETVEIYAYCIMPNHFHILLKQIVDNGISSYLSLIQNSITKYINEKLKRHGHVFQGQFKSVRIEDDEQFLHVHRYIDLNPYTSCVVKNLDDLKNYRFSSIRQHLNKEGGFCATGIIEKYFKSHDSYRKFLFNHADYQRHLGLIKHLIKE